MESNLSFFSLPFVDNADVDFSKIKCDYDDLHPTLPSHGSLLGADDDVLAQFLSGDEPLEEPDLNGPTTLHCEICRKQFDNAKKYYGHLRVHSKDNLWMCDKCPHEKFSTKQQLMKHSLIHKPLERVWQCPQCDMSFEALWRLQQHLFAKHIDYRPHKCNKCEMSFHKLSDLKKHQDIHDGVKKHECEVCKMKFGDVSNMKRHMLCHRDEKPYACPGCGNRFKQIASMRRHSQKCALVKPESELTDKTIRKNYCRVCGLTFQYKSALLEHCVRQHTNNPLSTLKTIAKKNKSGELHTDKNHPVTVNTIHPRKISKSYPINPETNLPLNLETSPVLHRTLKQPVNIHNSDTRHSANTGTNQPLARSIIQLVNTLNSGTNYSADLDTINPLSKKISRAVNINTSRELDLDTSKPVSVGANPTFNSNTSPHINLNTNRQPNLDSTQLVNTEKNHTLDRNTYYSESLNTNRQDTTQPVILGTNHTLAKNSHHSDTGNTNRQPVNTETNHTLSRNTHHCQSVNTNRQLNLDTSHSVNLDINHNRNVNHLVNINTGRQVNLDTSYSVNIASSHLVNYVTTHPVNIDTNHPLDKNISFPVNINTNRLLNIDTSHPVDIDTSQPVCITTSRSLNLTTSQYVNVDTNSSVNVNIDTNHPVSIDISRPLNIDTNRTVDNIVDDILSAEDDYLIRQPTSNQMLNYNPHDADNHDNLMQIELLKDMNQMHILDDELLYNDLDFDSFQTMCNTNDMDYTDRNELLFDIADGRSLDQDLMNALYQVKGDNLSDELLNESGNLNTNEKVNDYLMNPVVSVNECSTIFESDVDLEASTNLAANLNQLIGENSVQYISTEHDDTFIISLNSEIDAEQLTDMLNIDAGSVNESTKSVVKETTKGENESTPQPIANIPENNNSLKSTNQTVIQPILVKIDGVSDKENIANNPVKNTKAVKRKKRVVYVCRKCNKIFKKKDNYKSHRATHNSSLRHHKCSICEERFSYRSTLNKHVKRKHMPPEKASHECTQCDKSYAAAWMLKRHLTRDHDMLLPFVCNEKGCGKKFYKQCDLDIHKRFHANERPYTCDICNRGFHLASHFKRHVRTFDCTTKIMKKRKSRNHQTSILQLL